MIIYCEDNRDRINKMNWLLSKIKEGYKWAALSKFDDKIKSLHKGDKSIDNFLNFGRNRKTYYPIRLNAFRFRLLSDKLKETPFTFDKDLQS